MPHEITHQPGISIRRENDKSPYNSQLLRQRYQSYLSFPEQRADETLGHGRDSDPRFHKTDYSFQGADLHCAFRAASMVVQKTQ